MLYTGVDIEDISRFVDKDELFLHRIFTKNELNYCAKFKNPAPHLAARFCAKEAVVKATSEITTKTIPYSKIEILNYENGAPYVNCDILELKNYKISLSLSHEKQKAVAFVVVVKEQDYV